MSRAVVEHYDARAATYDESVMHRRLAEAVARFCGDPGSGLVLDVATGTGLVPRALRELYGERHVLGVDLSPGMLAVARTAHGGGAFAAADAAALPLPTASVDLLTCVTALHLMPHWQAVLAEWRRVVRPGGRVVTATFGDPVGSLAPDPRPFPRFDDLFRTPDLVEAAFAPHGFTLARTTRWSHHPDGLLLSELR